MRIKKLTIISSLFCHTLMAQEHVPVAVNTSREPMMTGQFEATWQSLQQYETPEWFRNAKFGIWAHWGPQCQPGQGDWYGRLMYDEGSEQYKWHLANYGHPSKAGFKEVINSWKAERWDPEKLVRLYKRVGAQYFFAMANHHDNLDLWDSKYQEWNTVRVGPRKDIMSGWAAAAKKYELPFGISVHASHAWTWFETAQRSDTSGPFAGVPYDGKLTKPAGAGTWWEGLDPQELYAQDHPLSRGSEKDIRSLWSQWNWDNGASIPSNEYCEKFYNRTIDLINRFDPDLLYFDDSALPLWPVSDAGLKIAAHYYNRNMANRKGKLNAVLFGKVLTDQQKECMVWDVERGAPDAIQAKPWQTCTCIGNWHYDQGVYERGHYKSAATVIRTLIDIISKNGNLLLNIPVRGDGSIDEKEEKILEDIAAWMDVHKESIFDTRPWKVYGEGPIAETDNPINAAGFNEGKLQFSGKDIRYNVKGNILYASVLGIPDGDVALKSLGLSAGNGKVKRIRILGSKEKVRWKQGKDALVITRPGKVPNDVALVFKVEW